MGLKREELFEALQDVDERRLEHSERKAKQNNRLWSKWGSFAACLCLFILAVTVLPQLFPKDSNSSLPKGNRAEDIELKDKDQEDIFEDDFYEDQVVDGFSLNGSVYVPISYEEAVLYGLEYDSETISDSSDNMKLEDAVLPDESFASSSELRQATKADLGEVMGIIQDCEDESLNGCMIYHYAAYPDNNSICIVEHDGIYEFYCTTEFALSD